MNTFQRTMLQLGGALAGHKSSAAAMIASGS
jgi:hypothetical protein